MPSLAVFADTKEALGSSFQLSHVVPEDEEEEDEDVSEIAADVIASGIAREQERTLREDDEAGGMLKRAADRERPAAVTESDELLEALGRLNERDKMEVVFRDLCYGVSKKAKITRIDPATGRMKTENVMQERRILRNVSGVFRPGRLTAIMGSSGAGKTSLLNIIAGEVTTGVVSGKILVNGTPVSGHDIRELSGYVHQDDVIMGTMTVREAIEMSAALRLPKSMSQNERRDRVERLIETLNLRRAENTQIGNATIKGVSGGERKRCALGRELLVRPAILFLDEPTTGLDTFTALSVIKTLKVLAATGRTVVVTIHQPSSDIYKCFDDYILMADGRIMYMGEAGRVAVDYFARCGFPCPRLSNPPDFFFMSILHSRAPGAGSPTDISWRSADESDEDHVQRLLDLWENSKENKDLQSYMSYKSRQGGVTKTVIREYTSFGTQLSYLYIRACKNAYRDPAVLVKKVAMSVFQILVIGLTYLNTDQKDGQAAIQNRFGVLYYLVATSVMQSMSSNLTIFGNEKHVFLREEGAGYYKVTPYFLSKIFAEGPIFIVFPAIECICIFNMVGLRRSADKLFIAVAITCLSSLTGMSIGVLLACIFPSLQAALSMVNLLLMPMMLFSGYIANLQSMAKWLSWLQYLSPMRYGFDAFCQNEFIGLSIPIPATPSSPATQIDGKTQVDRLGFGAIPVGMCLVILLVATLLFLCGVYVTLSRIATTKRRKSVVGVYALARRISGWKGPDAGKVRPE
ncbi:hypothetical protein DFJ73DRAFT_827456 [Zopfochytrium polystomum]|nr:hypothetical protein DFJ73DRAFT_827456 [Zopfochytrium polystomum]